MKIALVVLGFHPRLGGYGSHVYGFAKELSRNHEVTVLTSTQSPKGLMPVGIHREEGVRVMRFKTWFKGITPGLYFHLKNNDYDLVHVFGYQSFQPLISSLAFNGPLVFTPFYHPFGEHNIILRRLFDAFIGRQSLKNADLVIAQTPLEKELLEEKGARKVLVRPIPVKEQLKIKASLFKKKFNIKGPFILSVGRLSPEKRFDELIRVYSKLKLKHKLVIAGGGDPEPLNRLAEELGVKDKVVITGFLSEELLASAYEGASLFVLISKYESFGLVFAEAMSHGVPCVGLSIGAVPFVIDDAGLVVDDLSKVGGAIKKVLKKNFKKKALSNAKRFSKKNFMKQMLELYEGLV